MWSFPDRGRWATHGPDYPGNWSPYVPRNLLLRYTKPGDLVLDPMMGGGTTLVECKLLGRNAIGVDIDPAAVALARRRLDFGLPDATRVAVHQGDARSLTMVADASIDLVATHPPYAGIIRYGSGAAGDLSRLRGLSAYLKAMEGVARECLRVLRSGSHCAILIGDTRQRRHYVPLASLVMQRFLSTGFLLREDIIKLQWNMRGTRARWRGVRDFYLIAHEHLFVFRKPRDAEDARAHRWSAAQPPT